MGERIARVGSDRVGHVFNGEKAEQTGFDFDHAGAQQSFDRARTLVPESRTILSYEQKGQFDKVFEMWLAPFTRSGDNRAFVDAARQAYVREGWRLYARAELDQRLERMAESNGWTDLISQPPQLERTASITRPWVNPHGVAAMYVRLGEKDSAFEWLEKAYEERTWYLLLLKTHAE